MFPVISIGPNLQIPTYVLTISLAYCLAIFWIARRCRSQKFSFELSYQLNLAIMFGGFVGARLFHIAYEYPQHYLNDPINIIKFWQGGFVFYGGALGALLTCLLVLYRQRVAIGPAFDFYAPVIAGTYALGRFACLLNGCCYGKVCELPWGIHIPGLSESLNTLRHPTQLYASLWEILLMLILLKLEKTRTGSAKDPSSRWQKFILPAGQLFLFWLCLHSLGRLAMETLRDDPRGPELFGLSVSSLMSLIFCCIAMGLFFRRSRASTT